MGDLSRKYANWRLTEDEKFELFDILAGDITPRSAEAIKLVSLAEIYEEAKAAADKAGQMQGLSTGYANIDQMTLGLGPGELIVVYGYTSMGKSQLSQNIALNVAANGHQVLFLGLELTTVQNAARVINMAQTDEVAAYPFVFPDSPDIGYQDIQTVIKQAKESGPLGLVVVDQLQDLIHSTTNEAGELGQIMAELKRASIIHKVPIIVVSHVNRTGSQPGPPPLETLKGSSSIEQKTDIAISVYQNHKAEPGDPDHKVMAVALTKNRQRGMHLTLTSLEVGKNMRLRETRNWNQVP